MVWGLSAIPWPELYLSKNELFGGGGEMDAVSGGLLSPSHPTPP